MKQIFFCVVIYVIVKLVNSYIEEHYVIPSVIPQKQKSLKPHVHSGVGAV